MALAPPSCGLPQTIETALLFGGCARIRTLDPLIKRHRAIIVSEDIMLSQMSVGVQKYRVRLATWWLSPSLTRSQKGSLWFKLAHANWTPSGPPTTPLACDKYGSSPCPRSADRSLRSLPSAPSPG